MGVIRKMTALFCMVSLMLCSMGQVSLASAQGMEKPKWGLQRFSVGNGTVCQGVTVKQGNVSIKKVAGKTFRFTVKQTAVGTKDGSFGKDTKLGDVIMNTYICYAEKAVVIGGADALPAMVMCDVTVNPYITSRNSNGTIRTCGVLRDLVVKGYFNINIFSAYPKKEAGVYQLSSSTAQTNSWDQSGSLSFGVNAGATGLGFSFGKSSSFSSSNSSTVTQTVSSPVKLYTYTVNNNTANKAFWQHTLKTSAISSASEAIRNEQLSEISSTTSFSFSLSGYLNGGIHTTADYIHTGVTPGTYYVDWTGSNVSFYISATFSGAYDGLKSFWDKSLGTKGQGFSRIK